MATLHCGSCRCRVYHCWTHYGRFNNRTTAEPEISSFLFQRMNNITVFITLVISGVWMFTKRGEMVGTFTQILLLILRENSTTFIRTVTDNWTALGLGSVRKDFFSKKKHYQWILKNSVPFSWNDFRDYLKSFMELCQPAEQHVIRLLSGLKHFLSPALEIFTLHYLIFSNFVDLKTETYTDFHNENF